MIDGQALSIGSGYGTDANGLICGYLFAGTSAARPIGSQEALAWLRQEHSPESDAFIWLHVSLAHAGAEAWLRASGIVPMAYFDAMHEGSHSTRIERDGDTLFAVVNDVTFDFAFEASDVSTLWMSLCEKVVVTARARPLRAVDRLRRAVKNGEALSSPVALLDHLLCDQADELQSIVRAATERVDDIEDEMLGREVRTDSAELTRLRRLTTRLQRLLAPEPNALMRTLGNPPQWVTAADTLKLRRTSDEFSAVLRDISAIQERTKLLQDESAAQVAKENNRSLFILTMVTVLALPINLVSGLLGMNVGGLPLAQHPQGFWWVVSIIAFLTLALGAYVVQRLAPRG